MITRIAGAFRDADCWAFVRAYVGRHTRFNPGPLDNAGGRERFLELAFIASGRNFAVAASFLPRSVRREGRIAFLACRALDAFEDLSPNDCFAQQGIKGVVNYLAGSVTEPPSTTGLRAWDESDVVEISLAARLPIIRGELRMLSITSQQRVQALIADIAEAMLDGKTDRRAAEYGERLLGRAARYALQLIGMRSVWPIDFGSIGRVTQAANLLRDAEKDNRRQHLASHRDPNEARLRAILEALEASPVVPSALAAFESPPISRARAAVIYVAATTASFYIKQFGHVCPRWLSTPLLFAVFSIFSQEAYLTFCRRLDELILRLVMHAQVGRHERASSRLRSFGAQSVGQRRKCKQEFETWLAMQHPDAGRALALHRVCRLAHIVMETCDIFPAESILKRPPSIQTSSAILILDYLLACALRDVSTFGNRVLREFCELVSRVTIRAETCTGNRDEACEIAAFLATVVGRARGLTGDILGDLIAEQRLRAQYLHHADHEGTWLQRRRASANLKVFCTERQSMQVDPPDIAIVPVFERSVEQRRISSHG